MSTQEKPKPQLEDGYLQIANEIVDQFQTIHLSGNEWKILWVVLRKTYGWKKKEDRISLTQFQRLTNLSRPNAHKAIKQLVVKSLLLATPIPNGVIYGFNKHYSEWTGIQTNTIGNLVAKPLPSLVVKPLLPLVVKSLPKVVVKSLHTKEKKKTITKETIQKKVIPFSKIEDLSENDLQEIATRYKVPMAFVMSKKEDMFLWANEKAGRGKGRNWKLTLMNWVKRDALKIIEKQHDRQSTANKYRVTKV